jgi:signal transduction histidine kinase
MSKIWKKMAILMYGSPDKFKLEHRLLNGLLIVLGVYLMIITFFNVAISLFVPALLTLIIGFLFLILYYLSRIKNYYLIPVISVLVSFMVILPIFWFTSGGAVGSTPYAFIAPVIIATFLFSSRAKYLFILLFIIELLALSFIDYSFPHLIKPYNSRLDQFMDIIIMLVMVITSISFFFSVFARNYNSERQKVQHITDKLEKTLRELSRSNAELKQFAYTASHDLQEPLRKIKFFGERLLVNYRNALDEKACEYIERMNNAAVRMKNLIQALLEYSRVTTMARPFEPVDLNNIIKEVLGDLEVMIFTTKASIINENLPVVHADPLQMRQLFQNIIGNAIKYHKENISPLINIKSDLITIDGRDFCEISIADNGIGFENKYADQIFELFQRLEGRSQYEGTGIGLAICKKISERHNGFIKAYGKLGEGSKFVVGLPMTAFP